LPTDSVRSDTFLPTVASSSTCALVETTGSSAVSTRCRAGSAMERLQQARCARAPGGAGGTPWAAPRQACAPSVRARRPAPGAVARSQRDGTRFSECRRRRARRSGCRRRRPARGRAGPAPG
jgi:hypothetical protein